MSIQESWQVAVPILLYSHLWGVEWGGGGGHLKKEQFAVVLWRPLLTPSLPLVISALATITIAKWKCTVVASKSHNRESLCDKSVSLLIVPEPCLGKSPYL